MHVVTQVKAQIKLRFTSANKRAAVCARSFSLTQKAAKREYKAFESSLRTIDAQGQQQTYVTPAEALNAHAGSHIGAIADAGFFLIFLLENSQIASSPD